MARKKQEDTYRCIIMLKPGFAAYTAAAAAELERVLHADAVNLQSATAQAKNVKCVFQPADSSISIKVALVLADDSVAVNDLFISVAFGFAAAWDFAHKPRNAELSFEERLNKNYYSAAHRDKADVALMQTRLSNQFHDDVMRELKLEGHPKADTLWNLACERGDSEGFSAVWREAQELARLLR